MLTRGWYKLFEPRVPPARDAGDRGDGDHDARSQVTQTLSCYEAAVDELSRADINAERVSSVLLARDAVARALVDADGVRPSDLQTIMDTDGRLRECRARLVACVERSTFAKWRDARRPPQDAWWWSLDITAPKGGVIWVILAGFCITVSLSVTADIARRFLSTGPDILSVLSIDILSVLSILVQVLLAVLAGSTFSQFGGQAAGHLLPGGLRVRPTLIAAWKLILALVVLLIVFCFWLFLLPVFAKGYNNRGEQLRKDGRMTRAIQTLQRAISLEPDSAEAHYNLANAYEDVLDYEKALGEYQRAILADPNFVAAQNNLARLFILRRQEFTAALTLLNPVISAAEARRDREDPQQVLVRYSLYKNRGWALFRLEFYDLAQQDLAQALRLRADDAAAHCLLAQVREAQHALEAALPQWEACLRYARPDMTEADWLARARQRLGDSPRRSP